ncbi:hypothetical protein DC3_55320 [Deinococcus cellulosilyticus NBRC 106333 = KACC 11606]|uniref:Uncharacterized protein n=2 Tax=Deinococcus cellulosilyticus TaxID=401558 RepID=A0A511NBD1_DEIC1|nr:hypothetical protein DC3_55320 [Deinococcus cellulosilyticus NBRC 106333 = KACC 11606]
MDRAKKEFLEGTGCSSPAQVIEFGLKTMQDWLMCLDRCREEAHALRHPPKPQGKPVGRPRMSRT